MATLRVQTAAGLAIVGGVSHVPPAGAVPVAYDLFGPFPDGGLLPQNTAGAYDWAEDALTANVQVLNFDRSPSQWGEVLYALWRVVWLPNSASNGVRLIHADSGPANITQIAELTNDGSVTPTVSSADVTNSLNALVTAGIWKQIGMQVKSGGTMRIYSSRIEVVWQIS